MGKLVSRTDWIDQILENPDAFLIMQELQSILNAERQKREAFYNDIDERVKAEFINGEIVIHSPVKKSHNDSTGLLYQLMSPYVRKHRLGFVGIEKIMTTFTRNDYEPDLCFFLQEKAQSFQASQTLFPVPDLIVEILSKGTAQNDRGIKYQDYEAHGVVEYWIIDPDHQVIEQYHLRQGQYELVLKTAEGSIKSFVIEGFQIPVRALFDDELNLRVLTALLQGSPVPSA